MSNRYPSRTNGVLGVHKMIQKTHKGHRDYFTYNGNVFTSAKALRDYLRDQRS